MRIGAGNSDNLFIGSFNETTTANSVSGVGSERQTAKQTKLPKIQDAGYYTIGDSGVDTEYDAAFRALMNAARRSGVADKGAQARFAASVIGEPTAENRKQFSLAYSADKRAVEDADFKDMRGRLNTYKLLPHESDSLRRFRDEYAKNGGAITSGKELAAPITAHEKQLVAHPPYLTGKNAAVNNAADAGGIVDANASPTITITVKLPNTNESLNDRALLGYVEDRFGYEKMGLWGEDAIKVRDAAKNANVEIKVLKTSGAGANEFATVELSRADAQKVRNLALRQRAEITRTEAIVQTAIDKTAAQSFMRGFFRGAYNDLRSNAELARSIGAAVADPIGTAKAVYEKAAKLGAAVAELPKFGAQITNSVGAAASSIAQMSPAEMTAFAKELTAKGVTGLENVDGAALFEKLGEVAGTVAMEAVLGKGLSVAFSAFKATKAGAALIAKAEAVGASAAAKAAHFVSDEAAAAAAARITARLGSPTFAAGAAGAELLPDLAKVAGNKLLKAAEYGGMRFEQFAREMTGRFGEKVKPYLEKLYRDEMTQLKLKVDEKEIADVNKVWKAQEANAKIGINSTDEITGADYAKRTEFRKQVHEAEPIFDRIKHVFPAKSNEEAMRNSINGKPAQYTLEFRKKVESKEKGAMLEAMRDGTFVKDKETFYFFKKFDHPIGYNNGKPTQWMRIELTGNNTTYHGFPASLEQVKEKLPNVKE